MTAFLFSDLGKWLVGALVALAGVLGIYRAGKRDARLRAENRTLADHIKTSERIDNAPLVDNPDAAREWLHNRNSKQR